jgi:hypothetical protein
MLILTSLQKSGITGRPRHKTGGLAGRKLVVDFLDTHLSPDDARSALISACEEDFAMIGTAALFISNVDAMVGCTDKRGTATGLPDIPSVTTETAHQCAPVSYPINPSQLLCSTRDEHPQTWRANQGPIAFYERTHAGDLHGVGVYGNDVRPSVTAGRALILGSEAGGVKIDDELGVSALATQTEYAPIIQSMKDVGANYLVNGSDYATAVKIRREAKVQGIDAQSIVWNCYSNCYNELLIEEGGPDVEGQYAILNQLPFSETKSNKQLANYVKYTGKDKVDGFGAYAWIAGLLFRDAVDAVVERDGENGLTRQALLDELAGTHSFDAGGMWGTTDIATASRPPASCSPRCRTGSSCGCTRTRREPSTARPRTRWSSRRTFWSDGAPTPRRHLQPARMSSHSCAPPPRKYRESYSNDSRFRTGTPRSMTGTLPAAGSRRVAFVGSKKPEPIEYLSADRSNRSVPLAVRRRSAARARAFDARPASRDECPPGGVTYRSSHASV